MAKMNSSTPSRKITWATVAGSITALGVWLLNSYAAKIFPGWVVIPAEVTSELSVIVGFIVGYKVPPGETEKIV